MKFLNSGINTAVILIFTVLFLVACSGHRKLNDGKTYKYKCENGAEFTTVVHQYKDQVIVRTGDKQYILDITPAGSGEKYTDGMNTFFSKGNEAMLELENNKVYKGCKVVE